MKALLEHDHMRNRVDVWFYREARGGVQTATAGDNGSWEWGDVLDRSQSRPDTPSLSLDYDMLEQLVAVASETMPPDRAQGRHLDDAIATRDRLLALVERTTHA